MKNKLVTVFITSCLLSGAALADDDCTDPVADWQPKERLRQIMMEHGWDVKRIKVDDGCYEVKGLDRNGHEVEAKVSPASLRLVQFKVKFQSPGVSTDYLNYPGFTPEAGSEAGSGANSGSGAAGNKRRDTIEDELRR